MRNLKKFLALALAMLMLVSCFSVAAFDDVKDDSKYAEAVSLLSDLKVIRGFSDSEFKPEENVTRWQMALMIAKLRTGKVEETDARWYDVTNTTSFNDLKVDHYYGSIGYCFGNDIILGTDATTFEPERGIMFQEALAMAVRALGYASGEDKAEMNAGYPWTFVSKAVALNLDENLEDVNYEQTLTRAQTAQLLNNMLTAAKKTGSTFAKDAFNLTQATIVLTATNKVNVLDGDPVIKQNYVQFRTLNEYGQLGAVAYHCQKSELGITDDAEKYLYNSYNVLTQDDFESFVKVNKVEAVTTAKVAKANAGKITIDGTTYKLVDKYTDLNNKPTNKYTEPEIIVLNENADYALMTGYNTTTAYPEMVLFDDNLDGQPDRGLYKEYQLGQYKSTSRIANVAGSGTTTILYGPIVVGLSVAANDRIVYSYNETANVLYVKEKAEKVSGVIGGINTATGKITVGGVEYPIGVANLPGAWTTANITTNMLGKNASIYTIDGKVIYFTDYANSSKFIVYDSYIGLNQLGYPNAYAYVQNNVKEVITISSYQFKTYQNYNYATGVSYWFNDFLANAQKGDVYFGTVDLNGYYNLEDATSSLKAAYGEKKFVNLLQYTDNAVYVFGTGVKYLTDNTIYIVGDGNGNFVTAKGKYSAITLPTATTTLIEMAADSRSYVKYSSNNVDLIYIENGKINAGVHFSQDNKAAANTLVYFDEDMTLVTSQQINKVDAYTWEYTYANAIDVVNGGLLPYNIVCYNYPLSANAFYLIEAGVVTAKITPYDIAAAQAEILASNNTVAEKDTAAYAAASKDAAGNVYIAKFPAGSGVTGTSSYNTITLKAPAKVTTKDSAGNDVVLTPDMNAYNGYTSKTLYGYTWVGYAMIDGNIKNTDASNVAPKNLAGNAVFKGAMTQKAQYVYNYVKLEGDKGSTGFKNLVSIVEYADDYDNQGYPTIFTRAYGDISSDVTATSYPAFVEYIYYKSSSVAGTAGWDALRAIVGGTAQGDVDVTGALKLYTADGTYIDAAKYGLTYTVKDAIVTASDAKYTCLEIRRDPMNKLAIPANNNFYFTHETAGKIYMHEKITINLADASVWYADSTYTVLDKVTATSGSYEFTLFVDLGTSGLTLAQVENALRTMRTTIYKADALGKMQMWDDVVALVNYYSVGGTEYAFTMAAHQNFAAADYAFELSFYGDALDVNNALSFDVA